MQSRHRLPGYCKAAGGHEGRWDTLRQPLAFLVARQASQRERN